ncbi:uncharacterized protein LOC144169471 [Haemaphysalis longicornis]
MKAFLWVTLLSLAAVAYGASVAPQVVAQKPVLSKEVEAEVLEKTGKSLETLGRLLQGNDVVTKENQEEILEIMEALSKGEIALSDEASEYFWPIIIRGVAQGVIAHVVHKKLNNRG